MSATEESSPKKSKIEFILKNPDEDISGCTLVAGFYGLGRVGFISVNHIVQKLDAKLIGYLVSEFIPPFLSIYCPIRLPIGVSIFKFFTAVSFKI